MSKNHVKTRLVTKIQFGSEISFFFNIIRETQDFSKQDFVLKRDFEKQNFVCNPILIIVFKGQQIK